jgi:signal transduction histidine kinase
MRDVGKELAVEQAKNEFISVTSHQMRTPLATMRWHIERLLRPGAPPTPEVLRDYLERIERNNKRMIRLAEALLDVSRIDLEVSKSKDVEVDIPDVVKEVLDEIDEETLSKRTIVQNYEGIRGQKTLCDPYLVRVVLENFIENAINYTKPKGKITITVVVDGDSLRIDVNDDGIGIAADMKDKIFSKFVRGKDATAMQPAGTGLGLYITKSLVERAGGKIWFESKRNEGSTFSVRFPLSDPNNN